MTTGDVEAPSRVTLSDIAVTNYVDSTCLIRRDHWELAGGFDESNVAPEDWLMWMVILGRTGGSLVKVPGAVLHYRARVGSRNSRFPKAGPGHRRVVEIAPDIASELYIAAAGRAEDLMDEVKALRVFQDY